MEFNIVEWFKAGFLGIVEGITEWLPISSTGHMILVDEFIKMNISEEFKALFLVVIQLGAILQLSCCILNGSGRSRRKRSFLSPRISSQCG